LPVAAACATGVSQDERRQVTNVTFRCIVEVKSSLFKNYWVQIFNWSRRAEVALSLGSIEQVAASPGFARIADELARNFMSVHDAAPRLAGLFATQQRWFLSHVALGLYFKGLAEGRHTLNRRDLVKAALHYRISSRNTAVSFFLEAIKYAVVVPVEGVNLRTLQPYRPSAQTLELLGRWYTFHLAALDRLDGGGRCGQFLRDVPGNIAALQPALAHALLECPAIRSHGKIYSLFTWMDDGGLLMDRLIAGSATGQTLEDGERLLTDVTSLGYLARSFGLSRSHVGRKFAAAEAIGAIGWGGRPGRSPIWISLEFRREYYEAQAAKMIVLDQTMATLLPLCRAQPAA
jgi:hypothetical protein